MTLLTIFIDHQQLPGDIRTPRTSPPYRALMGPFHAADILAVFLEPFPLFAVFGCCPYLKQLILCGGRNGIYMLGPGPCHEQYRPKDSNQYSHIHGVL